MSRYPDVPEDHLFYQDIEDLALRGMVGVPDGDPYRPDDPITRGQNAAYLNRVLNALGYTAPDPEPEPEPPVEPPEPPTIPPDWNVNEPITQPGTIVQGGTYNTIDVHAPDVIIEDVNFQLIQTSRNISAPRCTVRNSTGKQIMVNSPRVGTNAVAPSGWLIEQNEIDGGGFCIGINADGPDYQPITDTYIGGNILKNPRADAIRGSNYDGLHILDNEITGVIENGAHNDGFQSVWGGRNLVFAGNWLHDNNCQGFFIKDGYVTNIVLEDNLFENNKAGSEPVVSQIWRAKNVTMRNNTIWDGSGIVFRDAGYSSMFSTGPIENWEMHHNVLWHFDPIEPGTFRAELNEHDNVFRVQPWRWNPIGEGSIIDSNGGEREGYGVSWAPEDKVFGPR